VRRAEIADRRVLQDVVPSLTNARITGTRDRNYHDAEQLDAQAQAQHTAQNTLELARASFREGNAGVLLVLDAERSYQHARLGYVRAVVQRYMDSV
jgi:hypothetical protein